MPLRKTSTAIKVQLVNRACRGRERRFQGREAHLRAHLEGPIHGRETGQGEKDAEETVPASDEGNGTLAAP